MASGFLVGDYAREPVKARKLGAAVASRIGGSPYFAGAASPFFSGEDDCIDGANRLGIARGNEL
jgi:hypothetical protein